MSRVNEFNSTAKEKIDKILIIKEILNYD